MQPLSAAHVLELTERCARTGATGKALELLAAGSPEADPRALAELPLGERDRRLLALRARTLGGPLVGRSRCQACGAALEFELATEEIAGEADAGPAELDTSVGGLELRLRQPNSFDLLAAEAAPDASAARLLLAERCVSEARRDQAPISPADLTESEIEAVGAALAAAASAIETRLGFECAACGHRWHELLDVAEFFAAELEVVAEGLVDEVDALARAYGWRESEILAMSARRRRLYLERLGR